MYVFMKVFSRQIYSYGFHISKLNNWKVIHDLYSQYLTQTSSKMTFFTGMEEVRIHTTCIACFSKIWYAIICHSSHGSAFQSSIYVNSRCTHRCTRSHVYVLNNLRNNIPCHNFGYTCKWVYLVASKCISSYFVFSGFNCGTILWSRKFFQTVLQKWS
jgi:hypothetical protein